MEATYLATQGMIDYRLGHAALGRALYEKAREISRRQKNMREEAWSLLFQAREERRFDSSAADRLLSEARDKVNALRAREATVAARLLEIVAT